MSYFTILSSEQVKFVNEKIKHNDGDHITFEEIMLYEMLYELGKKFESYPKCSPYIWNKVSECELNDEEMKGLINSVFGSVSSKYTIH